MNETAQEVAVVESTTVVESTSTAIIAVIERAALNPEVDIEKMERLLAMQERILDREAKMAFTSALLILQPKIPTIKHGGTIRLRGGGVQSTYARWEDISPVVLPLVNEHGFTLTFRTGSDGEMTTVTGVLDHVEGHREETTISLPSDMTQNKNAVQSVGSTTSYGKRYVATLLLNIVTTGEDDDGATAIGVITADQKDELIKQMQEVGADTARFLKAMGVDSLDAMPVDQYDRALLKLDAKRKRVKEDREQF